MLRPKNKFVRTLLRRRATPLFLLVMLLFPVFLVVPGRPYGSELGDAYVESYEFDVVENEWFLFYVKPNLHAVSAQCEPLDLGNPFSLSIHTDYTDELFGEVTAVGMMPESRGKYNLTVTLESNVTWDYVIGVYSRNLDFYSEYYGKNVKVYGYFVELRGPYTRLSGNWTVSVILNSHGRSSSLFSIELPTPVNSILFVTAAGLIVYCNVFLLLDTYFKNKKETVSSRRWILFGIVIIVSAVAIYQLYNFTTFTLAGGV